jgi:uncharacterized protein
MHNADFYITKLELKPHPEGGYYREIYRGDELISKGLPERFEGNRSLYSSIYFLLKKNDFSAFHILKADEIWHFYCGSTILLHILNHNGDLETVRLGKEIEKGEHFKYCVRAGLYFAAELKDKSSFGLAGCTVAPGFDFKDFAFGDTIDLTENYPEHKELIERLSTK